MPITAETAIRDRMRGRSIEAIARARRSTVIEVKKRPFPTAGLSTTCWSCAALTSRAGASPDACHGDVLLRLANAEAPAGAPTARRKGESGELRLPANCRDRTSEKTGKIGLVGPFKPKR